MDTLGRDRWNPPFKPYTSGPGELARAIEILGHIRRRPVLPTRHLGAFLGTKQYHSRILGRLHAAKLIYYHEESCHHPNANYRDMVWSISKKGDRFYEKHGGTEQHRYLNSGFRHAFGCSLIGASFDLGAKQHGLAIAHHAVTPQTYDGLTPDEPPFSLSSTRSIDFVGFEFDRNTESIKAVITDKLTRYERYFVQRHYERHGLQTAFVPVITTNERHMRFLMGAVKERVHPRLHDRFLFKVTADFTDGDLPPATGHIIEEPWLRIGGSFNILEVLKPWTSTSSKSSSGCERPSINR